jgi:hypothetical protein
MEKNMKNKNNTHYDIGDLLDDHWLIVSGYILLMIFIFVGALIFGYSMR